jgi:glycosyltransferase involved in cell wall biosynthesis
LPKRIKILFVIPTLYGGGSERVFINIIRTLDSNIFEKTILLVEDSGVFVDFIPPNVELKTMKSGKTRFSFFKLLRNIKSIKPEIIVSTTNRMNLLLLFVSYFLSKKIKIVVREPNMPSAQYYHNQLPKYYLWMSKFVYPKADYVIAQTDEMKNEIENFYNIPDEKIKVLINPIDTKFIDKNVKNQKNPFDSNYINILASGRLRKQKGFDFLIKSFQHVVKKDSRYFLHILGKDYEEGKYKSKLVDLVNKLELVDKVVFHGFINNPFPYYKYSDLFVLSSKWEGLPNVVLENLYLQTPVVVTDCISFFHNIIKDGKNGFIVQYNDEATLAEKIRQYAELSVSKEDFEQANLDDFFLNLATD